MNELYTAIKNHFAPRNLSAAPAVSVGGGIVGIPCTAHGFKSGDTIILSGTTNYDGTYTVGGTTTTNQIDITAAFVAETFAITDEAQSGLYDAISGQLELKKARQSISFPYIVYFIVTDTYDLYWPEDHQEIDIQFNIYSQSSSPLEAGTIYGYLKEVFDDCDLTVSGWRHIEMIRDFAVSDDDIEVDPPTWGYAVQYNVILEKER